jgi:hypothetical protein
MKIDQTGLIYRADRENDTCGTVTVARKGVMGPLDPRLDLRKHSPDGFSWGYGGSGPAQLSLAILADYFGATKEGDKLAESLYQDFKENVVARKESDLWELTGAEVGEVIVRILVYRDRAGSFAVSQLRGLYFEKWSNDHENSEKPEDWDNVKIDAWCDERIRGFLGDYLPLKTETIDGFIKASAS